MKIRHRHTKDKIQDVSFINWFYDTPNKEDFIVIDWGDLVYWQLMDKKGNKTDHKIIARDHAVRIIDGDDKRNTLREITDSEWADLRSQFYDSPSFRPTEREEQKIELRNIEKELLNYISKSGNKIRTTKKFADAKGFSVSTVNDVAKSLKDKFLITTEIEAGIDANTLKSFTSFRCESTPLGNELLKRINQSTVKYEEVRIDDERSSINAKKGDRKIKKLTIGEIFSLIALIIAIIVLFFGDDLYNRYCKEQETLFVEENTNQDNETRDNKRTDDKTNEKTEIANPFKIVPSIGNCDTMRMKTIPSLNANLVIFPREIVKSIAVNWGDEHGEFKEMRLLTNPNCNINTSYVSHAYLNQGEKAIRVKVRIGEKEYRENITITLKN